MAAASTVEVPLMEDYDDGPGDVESGSKGGIRNDFAFHNNVAGASKAIRMGFLRKVYGLLAVQLIITTMIAGACLFTPTIKETIHAYPGFLLVAFVASFALLIGLHIKRKESPINLILLALFVSPCFSIKEPRV